ncbi:PREDICTED: F-box protein SKIP23-like [Nelumbo nucifera]|uniref:F-box domain-containing protein n=2 Tax=Nelumbo nucifera TaxID=4432 RepID=A0A822ZP24_NELNU|nr:PREDICTED: F-box protein SKIP23-like [Nelumbo nucifera]DAD46657.1 TPA_asm: hypothetical protein HUJ06_016594 [Nelumbo nucifera]
MAEWSQLPHELLELIAKQLTTYFDVLRFRAVCSTWRSAVSPRRYRLPGRFPILTNEEVTDTSGGFYLSKRSIFRLGLPENHRQVVAGAGSDGWLIKVEEDTPEVMHLLNPLSRNQIKPLPATFPKVLDLSEIRVSELGQEYVLQYVDYRSSGDADNLYMEKVVFSLNPAYGHDYMLLTIHVSGKLAMFKSGDETWTIIQDLTFPYDDVIHFKGKFYAVDHTGRTVTVDSSPAVTVIAFPVFGGDKKFLVESEGDLLLVDMYLSVGPDDDPNNNEDEDAIFGHIDSYIIEKTVKFEVFKLDPGRQKWVSMKSLGDRLLFLGDNCSFSASASDFAGCKGNCIYFTDNFFHSNGEEDGAPFMDHDIGVFNLEDGSIGPLASYPGYSKLFWPPPSWIASTMSEECNRFKDLTL